MYELTIRSLETKESIKVAFRECAENLANDYYDCIDVYSVEITDATTGEILYLKAKG